jgi:hypothetical protein
VGAGESRPRGTHRRFREVGEGYRIEGEGKLRCEGALGLRHRIEEFAIFLGGEGEELVVNPENPKRILALAVAFITIAGFRSVALPVGSTPVRM